VCPTSTTSKQWQKKIADEIEAEQKAAKKAYGGRTMTRPWTDKPPLSVGDGPVYLDSEKVSIETYEAMIAAMDKMIAEAPPTAQGSAPPVAQAQDGPPK
jgi:hypothetical protein